MKNQQEGYFNTIGGKVWYKIVGNKGKVPLVVVHGGPGCPHDYLEPLEDLADEREVVFYDQLGCGKSDKFEDKSLWTSDYFVSELSELIKSLNLKEYHLLGQSWGAAVVTSFALKKPKGLLSIVLSDPYMSTPKWEEDATRLIKQLPKEMQKAINSDVNSEEFKEASKEYYKRFVKNFDIEPEAFKRSNQGFNRAIYNYMWGPKEYKTTGTLKSFDLTDQLYKITLPVFLVCGRYDEATPEAIEYFAKLFSNAQTRVFEKSEHNPYWYDREEYMQSMREFFNKTDL